MAVVFNTGRVASLRTSTLAQLVRNGFPVDGLCLRGKGKTLPYGKQRCRDSFIAEGYTLIANVGNNDTDFVGDGYEKAYVLPNYGGCWAEPSRRPLAIRSRIIATRAGRCRRPSPSLGANCAPPRRTSRRTR